MFHAGGCVLNPVAAFWSNGLFFSKRHDYFLPPCLSPHVSQKQGNLLFVVFGLLPVLFPYTSTTVFNKHLGFSIFSCPAWCLWVLHPRAPLLTTYSLQTRCIFSINCCSNQITLTEAVLPTWILRQITVSFIDEVFNQGRLIQRNEIHLASTNSNCNLVCQFGHCEQNQ